MRKSNLFLLLVALLFSSCDMFESNKKKGGKKIKDGVVKQYRANNVLKNEITYKDGVRHGVAKTYYEDGTLRQKIDYKMGKKHGEAITYYENGNVYQSTPYVENKIHGIRKKYRQNGKLMAEIPYNNDMPCQGLVEYLLDGSKKKNYPSIVFKTNDNILKSGKYDLEILMSDKSRNVDYYINTPLSEEGCLVTEFGARSNYKPGVMKLTYNLPEGTFVMEEIKVLAVVKTRLGNPYITQAKHNLAIENRGF
ncbi:toxin-antitoxin system YwqK family antitoxin [Fulvivirga lutea]|uniref:Toxin-antitoxin system YwqK family antitoxin n=1 Tax=Fulvivirga lutea TaxID=2810512 RepID=A0A974WIH7_9BACT|nr:toxin-antitoxin system YwqK family antitoxin [Fulvivirga lutea]QSE98378.1 toxin-antitoxin system YwqK family antitoxin [Fulvivirga lutea]